MRMLQKLRHNKTARECFSLTWPVSLQAVLAASLGMIDIIMIGHLGEEAVAAMALAGRIQFVLLIVGAAFGTAASILVAQYSGAGQKNKLPGILAQIIVLGTIIVLALLLATQIYSGQIIQLGSDDPRVIQLSKEYLYIILPSLIPLLLYQILEGALRGLGQVKLPMVLGTIAMLLNILFNWLFIYGQLGLEPMAIEGAALATMLTRLLLIGLLLAFLLAVRHECLPSKQHLSLKETPIAWRKLLVIVIPTAVNFSIWATGTFAYQLIFGMLGTSALAAMGMIAPIEGTLISLFIGVANAATVIIGRKLGQNDFESAYRYAWNFAKVISFCSFCIGVGLLLLDDWLLSPYTIESSDTHESAKVLLWISAFGLCIKNANMMFSNGILRTGGDTQNCLIIDVTGMWLIGIPATFLLASMGAPLYWVFVCAYLEEIVKMGLFIRRILSKLWMRNLTHEEHQTISV